MPMPQNQKARHHQGSKHSMTANHQHKQNRIPCDCHSKAQVEHTDTAHKLPQQRKQYHHGQNLYRSAKCTEKCIAVIPALPTHIILEKYNSRLDVIYKEQLISTMVMTTVIA